MPELPAHCASVPFVKLTFLYILIQLFSKNKKKKEKKRKGLSGSEVEPVNCHKWFDGVPAGG